MSSPIPKSYKILPHIRTLQTGVLLKVKHDVYGNNAPGLVAGDPNFEHGDQERFIPADNTCMFVAEEQFMASSEDKPMSAWVRMKLINGNEVVWYTLISERKSIWDFATFREKKRRIQEAFDEMFEIERE